MTRAATILRLCACVALAWMPQSALAQQQSVPNALQGFSQNKDKPVQIEAASLEVRDKDKMATFSGNVIVTQGDTTMRCKTLVVHYDTDSKSSGMKTAQPGPGGSSSIKKLEALGGVHVTQKDQTATGDKGLFDMKTNSITLSGNVLIAQGQNVLRGERLVVDMGTGAARVEGGRVSGVFVPSSSDDKKDKDKDKAKDKDVGKDKEAAKPKDAPKETSKAKETTSKPKETSKARDTTQEEVAAPVTRPAAREPVAATERTPVIRDNFAPERVPATPDAGATPERSKPVAPRGIY